MSNKVKWSGYEFSVHSIDEQWNDVGGIYVFCGISRQNTWVAVYIGQAVSLKNRLANHDRWNEAVRLGATHVHAMVVPLQSQRDAIEELLVGAHQPRLNTQLK